MVNTILSQKLSKAVVLEFNYSCGEEEKDAHKELVKSETNSNQLLVKLYSRLTNRTSLKSSLILSTIQAEYGKSQQKLLNYLIFGHLSKSDGQFAKPEILPKPDMQNTHPLPQAQQLPSKEHNSLKSQSSAPPELPSRPPTADKQTLKREQSLENLLMELSLESDEVTFSQVIVQFLKLNSKFEQTSTILNIVITIVIFN